MEPKQANQLINSLSPYLLQHAYNPVDWHPWSNELLQRASQENKPLIISIGYSACHWCHVMEHECFEDEQVAQVMNQHFITIKIDREERPDLDNIYMEAVQAMGLQGGWPLNVFATPDGKPFYGGTYFPKQHWIQLLNNVAKAWRDNEDELRQSAGDFANALQRSELDRFGLVMDNRPWRQPEAETMFGRLMQDFDQQHGGFGEAPKFPVPSSWQFVLRYFQLTDNPAALDALTLTLDRMSYGGIYDQLGGGFARYSVDGEWAIPHFEKMLYDNAQLLQLYSESWRVTQDPWHRQVALDTARFVLRELTSPDGGFYSALDADSEGEEGKFYVWTPQELSQILGEEDAALLGEYYNVDEEGNFEHGTSALQKQYSAEVFASRQGLSEEEWQQRLAAAHQKLMAVRGQRIRPGLDDKVLTSWNGLMISGFCAAYRSFGESWLLEAARRNADYLLANAIDNGQLYHVLKGSQRATPALLEDYAMLAQGLLDLYQVCFEPHYLVQAQQLLEQAMAHFFDPAEQLFFTARPGQEDLIADRKDLLDSVMPSANSVMAWCLFTCGKLMQRQDWLDLSANMLRLLSKIYSANPRYASHWASLYLAHAWPFAEIAIVGPDAPAMAAELHRHYLPNAVIAASTEEQNLPLLRDRQPANGQTLIYVCEGNRCLQPVNTIEAALRQLDDLL